MQLRYRWVLLGVCAMLATACSGGEGPVVRAPDVAGYEPARMIDFAGPDELPVLDHPSFEPARSVSWLSADAAVITLRVGTAARAYPLMVLTRHEVVNDDPGTPLVVTYSPLTNAALVYERTARLPGEPVTDLTFGTAGKLYQSNLVMYDRRTHSLWLQLTGTAVAGELKGAHLEQIPSETTDFATFRSAYPDGAVLSRAGPEETPFVGYDSRARPLEDLFRGPIDRRLPAMARVAGVTLEGSARAYPYEGLSAGGEVTVVNDTLGGAPVAVFWQRGVRSVLDSASVAGARLVGSSAVFEPSAGGKRLTFVVRSGAIVDEQTGSRWSFLGIAVEGPLSGTALPPVPHTDPFWFAWSAFVPDTTVWGNTEASPAIRS